MESLLSYMTLYNYLMYVHVHVGDQAVCVGDSLPASCVWYPAAGARPTQEECLPQSQCLIHVDMYTLPGIDILVHVCYRIYVNKMQIYMKLVQENLHSRTFHNVS